MAAPMNLFQQALRRHQLLRTTCAVLSCVFLVVSTWVFVGVHFFSDWWVHHYGFFPEMISQPLLGAIAFSGVLLGICLLSFMPREVLEVSGLELELQPIRKERAEIRERIEQEAVPNVFDTIQLGLNQIT